MRLRDVDLNLLVIFDAIVAEGNLTHAAKKLHLTQPALSHALARLRELFRDPLFVRAGRSMVPTPFAQNLGGTVRRALHLLEQELLQNQSFDPARTRRRLHVGLRDVLEAVWLPSLLVRLEKLAPEMDLVSVRVPASDIDAELSAGTVDMVVDIPVPMGGDDIQHVPLIDDRLVVLARKQHPAVGRSLDLETYLSQGHVLVSSRKRGPGIEDIALNRLGRRRRVALRCQNYFAACRVISQTDLLLTMPELYARLLNTKGQNRMLSLPIDVPPVEVHLYWHTSSDTDPANRWLREQIAEVAREGGEREGASRYQH
jgi:DNA-binding transcriptional LysR family regulator